MKYTTILKTAPAALTALALSSCLEINETVNLKKDGSGTIVEEVVLGEQMSNMIGMMAGLGGEGGKAPDMFSEEEGKKRATKFGEGVTLTKVEKIDKNGSKGARMTFNFTNINTVKISLSDSTSGMQAMAPQAEEAAAGDIEKPMTFDYKDGVLTVTNPSAEANEEQQAEAKKKLDDLKKEMPEGAEMPDPDSPEAKQMQAMMMGMMKDMKMSLKINVEDGISETNATHHEGNTVTLMEMNFAKLMENPETMKALQNLDMQDPAAMQKKFGKIEGVKSEEKKSVTIKVK